MTRRNTPHLRCASCRLHRDLCVCALLPRLETRTRLVLILHRYEQRKSTNTGQIAAACLGNSEVLVRGHKEQPSAPLAWGEEVQPIYFFPHEEATPLDRFPLDGRPVVLVVPDGTWRQASKVRKRVPGLASLPCATLPAGDPSGYRLRAEAHGHELATLEAIARAMGLLEGPAVREALEGAFRLVVERTLWSRGVIDDDDVTDGLPERASRGGPPALSAEAAPPSRA